MLYKKCCVTITDYVGPTSMPFNEFVLWRRTHRPEEKQVVILLFKTTKDNNVLLPEDVDLFVVGKSIRQLRYVIRQLCQCYSQLYFHIHEGKSVLFFSMATLLRYRRRTVYTLHSTYRNYPFHNKLFSFCASLLSQYVVCVSKTSYKYYPDVLKKLKKQHAMFIQNGVDIERIALVESYQKRIERPFTMVYVARLVPLKRHYLLLKALQNLPNVKLKLIGKGFLENELKRQTLELGLLQRVDFMGLLPRDDVYRELKNADLYVSASSYEGLPIGVLEAMGCGVPCLVSNIEQHREIAEKCQSLFLCRDDVNEWERNIYDIASLSSEKRSCIGSNGMREIEQYFSLTSMHEKYDILYYSINH